MSLDELATQAGVPLATLRFYETRNLLPSTSRGERRYDERDIVRVQLVLTAKRFGLSLDEARRMISEKDPDEVAARRAVAQIEERLTLLQDQRRSIDAAIGALRDALERLSSRRGAAG